MTAEETLDLLDRFTAGLYARDLGAVMALVTEDIVFESTSPPPDGARYEGHAETQESGATCSCLAVRRAAWTRFAECSGGAFCAVRCARSTRVRGVRQAGLPVVHQALLGTPLHGLGMDFRFVGSGFMVTAVGVG